MAARRIADLERDPRRSALRRQVVLSALALLACVPAFAWVILTRELSFAGSFGLFGGHWMLGVLMPIAVLSLVSLAHALGQLRRSSEASASEDADEPTDREEHDP